MSVSLRPASACCIACCNDAFLSASVVSGIAPLPWSWQGLPAAASKIRIPRPAQAIYDMMQMHLCGLHVLGCGREAGVLGRRADFLGDVRIGGRRRGRDKDQAAASQDQNAQCREPVFCDHVFPPSVISGIKSCRRFRSYGSLLIQLELEEAEDGHKAGASVARWHVCLPVPATSDRQSAARPTASAE
jgi:hypothetical protein